MGKFQKQLVGQVEKEETYKKEQDKLKKKYQIEEDVRIVEKNNTLKFLIRTIGTIVKLAVNIVIFILASVGLSAVLFPPTRVLLLEQAENIFWQFISFLP